MSAGILPYKYVAMNMVFALLAGLLINILGRNEILGILIWGGFFVVLMPAATMRLVMTGSLRGALNPAELVNVIRRIGKPYAALCAFVFFADLSRTWGMVFLGNAAGIGAGGASGVGFLAAMLVFLLSAGFWYFTYVICALVGYAMYQYADRLEISVVGPGEERLMSSTGRHADIKSRTRDALIGQMVTQGEIKEAIDLLNDDLRQRPNDLSLHARLHKLLLAENYTPKIEDHTEKYLAMLVKSQNWREALDLVEEALGTPRRLGAAPGRVDRAAGSGRPAKGPAATGRHADPRLRQEAPQPSGRAADLLRRRTADGRVRRQARRSAPHPAIPAAEVRGRPRGHRSATLPRSDGTPKVGVASVRIGFAGARALAPARRSLRESRSSLVSRLRSGAAARSAEEQRRALHPAMHLAVPESSFPPRQARRAQGGVHYSLSPGERDRVSAVPLFVGGARGRSGAQPTDQY